MTQTETNVRVVSVTDVLSLLQSIRETVSQSPLPDDMKLTAIAQIMVTMSCEMGIEKRILLDAIGVFFDLETAKPEGEAVH